MKNADKRKNYIVPRAVIGIYIEVIILISIPLVIVCVLLLRNGDLKTYQIVYLITGIVLFISLIFIAIAIKMPKYHNVTFKETECVYNSVNFVFRSPPTKITKVLQYENLVAIKVEKKGWYEFIYKDGRFERIPLKDYSRKQKQKIESIILKAAYEINGYEVEISSEKN